MTIQIKLYAAPTRYAAVWVRSTPRSRVFDATGFGRALDLGYAGVQLGTRFIASRECHAHDDYKRAILRAAPADIVLTESVGGIDAIEPAGDIVRRFAAAAAARAV